MAGEKKTRGRKKRISSMERRRERRGEGENGTLPGWDCEAGLGLGFGRGISVLGWYRGTCASPTGYSRVRYPLAVIRTLAILWRTVFGRVPGTRTGEDAIQCKRSYGWSLQ